MIRLTLSALGRVVRPKALNARVLSVNEIR
jgi:hypothetical protein